MASTGKTSTPVIPGIRRIGAFLVPVSEASAQTHPIGALIQVSAGFASSAATGCPTSLYGFAAVAGANLATDGASNTAVYRAVRGPDGDFYATLDGTWAASYVGATVAISMNTAGVAVLKVGTAVSASSIGWMQKVAPNFAIGDSYPVVSFVLADSAIQAAA